MIGYLFGLIRVIVSSVLGISQKKILDKNTNSFYLVLITSFFSALMMSIGLFFIEITFSKMLIIALIGSALLNIIAGLSSFYAIKHTDMSLLFPFFTLIPIFATINGIFLLGEYPTLFEWIGISLIFIGSLFLNHKKNRNPLLSFKLLFKNKGIAVALITVVAYSFSSVFDKIGIINSTAITYSILLWIFIGIGMMTIFLSLLIFNKDNTIKEIKKFNNKYSNILFISFFAILVTFSTMKTFQYLSIGVANSIFKLEAIILTISGRIFFNEEKTSQRLTASIIMAIGAIVIFLN